METTTTSGTGGRSGDGTEAVLRGWTPSLIAIAISAIAFGVVFSHEISGAVRVWIDSTAYNHCFLVLPLAAFLLWDRRALLPTLRPQPTSWPLAVVPVLSAIWVGTAALDILEGEQLVMVALFELIVLSLLGRRTFSALLAPLFFLFFLVPFGGFFTPWLQQLTTHFAVEGLRLVNIPVLADGFVIEIPEGSFEVAEACAGLRFLIASLVFGCFFATLVYRSPLRRIVFIALSVIVPILANGVRAFGLIALAHVAGSAAAIETDHVLYGWLFFTLVTLLLIAVGLSFRGHAAPMLVPASTAPYPFSARTGVIAAGALLLSFAGPIYLGLVGSGNSAVLPNLATPPVLGNNSWTRQHELGTPWRPSLAGADRELSAAYRDGSAEVSEFVGVYRLRLRNGELTSTIDRLSDGKVWHIDTRDRETTIADGASVAINSAVVSGDGQRLLVWWFYKIGHRTTESLLGAKFLQARALLKGNTGFGEFVVISTPLRASVDDARATLRDFLTAMSPARN